MRLALLDDDGVEVAAMDNVDLGLISAAVLDVHCHGRVSQAELERVKTYFQECVPERTAIVHDDAITITAV